ncbi:hypothetical protein PIB30_048149 [Stylosanthes scabra]|uniref:Uncharacterized protein n=1 Tax=Stylosanthes scabra TaxID=79078 RepID=A0ABU6UJR6_9FABA|nr:hypothetical protein [Stylosanthes scabra]
MVVMIGCLYSPHWKQSANPILINPIRGVQFTYPLPSDGWFEGGVMAYSVENEDGKENASRLHCLYPCVDSVLKPRPLVEELIPIVMGEPPKYQVAAAASKPISLSLVTH